jgi:hypothetical protein
MSGFDLWMATEPQWPEVPEPCPEWCGVDGLCEECQRDSRDP